MTKKTSLAITFTSKALEVLRTHMDVNGKLKRPVRVSLECVRATWVVNAKGYAGRDDVTLPKGCDMESIVDMITWAVEARSADKRSGAWRMPPLSTAYLCNDGRLRTLGGMLEGLPIDLMPHDEVDFDLLMACFGCDWTDPLSPNMHPHGLLSQHARM